MFVSDYSSGASLAPPPLAKKLSPGRLHYKARRRQFTAEELATIQALAIIAGGWWFHHEGVTLHQLARQKHSGLLRRRLKTALALGLVINQSGNGRYIFTPHAWAFLARYY